jgi:hypothetical protein
VIESTTVLSCDKCGNDESHDLDDSMTPEQLADREGWELRGTLLDRLLCPSCVDTEEDE